MTTPKAKIYKLAPKDGVITRDDVSLWEYTLLAGCRQIEAWQKYLPGGENEIWTATNDDPHNGITHATAATQTKLRNEFKNFLSCVAIHSPTNFTDTLMREATSFKEIIDKIKKAYGLDSQGEKFLSIIDIKLEFSPTFTYEQGYMMVKDFCMQSLRPAGKKFKNKVLASAEILSPIAENFIMKEFLTKVHPKLPEYVRNTKGHLFTEDRPTLACNKDILIDLMESMLADIEGGEGIAASKVSVAQLGQSRQFRGGQGGRGGQPRFPFRGQGAFRGPPRGFSRGGRPPFSMRPQAPGRREDCSHCLEARMFDSAKGHTYSSCPFRLGIATPYHQSYSQRSQPPSNGMKILLVKDNQVQHPAEMQPQAPLQHLSLNENQNIPDQSQHYSQYPYHDYQSDQYGYQSGYDDGYYEYDQAYNIDNTPL